MWVAIVDVDVVPVIANIAKVAVRQHVEDFKTTQGHVVLKIDQTFTFT